jgi:hypothetical protein
MPQHAQPPLGDALQPGPLEVVGFDAPLGGGPFGQEPLEHPPRHPDHAAVLADLDPELHGLPLGIPAGVLGHAGWEPVPLAVSCSQLQSNEEHPRGGRAR